MTMNRRSLLLGFGAALAAPAIVRADSLMKVAMLRKGLTEAMLLETMRMLSVMPPPTRYMAEVGRYVRAGNIITVSGRIPVPYARRGVTVTLPFVGSRL